MKLEVKNLKLDGDEVSLVVDFVGKVSELCNGRFGHDSLITDIKDAVSREVSGTIIRERSAEIIAKVDIEEIIKRIKLETIDGLLGRDRR